MLIEMQATALALRNGTQEHFDEMRQLLTTAGENLDNDDVLNSIDIGCA